MTDQPDAIALLKADHRKVEGLFEKFEKAKDAATKKSQAQQICTELSGHTASKKRFSIPPAPARSRKTWSRKPMSSMTAPR